MTQKVAQPRPCVYRYLYLGEILYRYSDGAFSLPRKQSSFPIKFNPNTCANIEVYRLA